MYVRIARFEGGTTDDILREAERIRADLHRHQGGEQNDYLPRELAETVSRIQVLVDRERSAVAVAVYCQTMEEARRADEVMSRMSPQSEGWGKRVSADIYEAVFDEATHLRQVA